MLTGGQFPYVVAGTMRDVLNNIITAEPAPPSEVIEARLARAAQGRRRRRRKHPPAVNAEMEAIVLKSLAKRRERRYQTAGELARDIDSYLSGRPTLMAAASAASPPPRRGAGRLRRTLAMVTVLLIVAAGIGAAAMADPRLRPAGCRGDSCHTLIGPPCCPSRNQRRRVIRMIRNSPWRRIM